MTEKITKSHCNSCSRETNHQILATRKRKIEGYDERVGDLLWEDTFEMLECCGCETISMRLSSWFEPTEKTDVTHFPPAVSRRPPPWSESLPKKLNALLGEVYASLHIDSRRLAMMGARALIDMLMLEKVGDVGSFVQKLEALERQGLIGKKNREVLAVALDAGNAAAHRGHKASKAEVDAVMDIVENVLQAVYQLEPLSKSIKKSIPPRKTKTLRAPVEKGIASEGGGGSGSTGGTT